MKQNKPVILQSKWKSKSAWTTFILGTVIIAAYFLTQETVTMLEGILGAILFIADGFGAFNSPTHKNVY